LLCDTDRTIGTAYGANADPSKGAARVGVIIDKDGKIKEWHARVDARLAGEVLKAANTSMTRPARFLIAPSVEACS
jgi:peroxiredoxin